jgi:hypothetical protein
MEGPYCSVKVFLEASGW